MSEALPKTPTPSQQEVTNYFKTAWNYKPTTKPPEVQPEPPPIQEPAQPTRSTKPAWMKEKGTPPNQPPQEPKPQPIQEPAQPTRGGRPAWMKDKGIPPNQPPQEPQATQGQADQTADTLADLYEEFKLAPPQSEDPAQLAFDELERICDRLRGNHVLDELSAKAKVVMEEGDQDVKNHLIPQFRDRAKAHLIDFKYNRLIRANPLEAEHFLVEKQKVQALPHLSEIFKLLDRAEKTLNLYNSLGPKEAQEALERINQGNLESLAPEEQIDLLAKLRLGDPNTLEERKVAMAKLYQAIPLQPEFDREEKLKRQQVLDALSKDPIVKEARENWALWSKDEAGKEEKLKALTHILTVQSELMGIKNIPKLIPENIAPIVHEDGRTQTDHGNASTLDRTIRVNDHPESNFANDFDQSLILVIHENTHIGQYELVDKLKAGALTAENDQDRYNQALLFLLNDGESYLGPMDGYQAPTVEGSQEAGKSADPIGYKVQPTERHAHAAEDEVSSLIETLENAALPDSRGKGRALIEELKFLITQANPGDLKLRLETCMELMQQHLADTTSKAIYSQINFIRSETDKLKETIERERTLKKPEERSKTTQEIEKKQKQQEALDRLMAELDLMESKLTTEMDDWLNEQPDADEGKKTIIERFRREIAEAKLLPPSPQRKRILQEKQSYFERNVKNA